MRIGTILVILAIAGLLRLYQLGAVPAGFHRDEAFLGYNAYSILRTGRDMSGHRLPLHLESFLQSPAGYSYLSIPFIAVFGLSPFSVRAASAILGTLSVGLIYLLAAQIFQRHRQRVLLATLAAGAAAVSPWLINLSRTATENTAVIFFLLTGVVTFLRSLETKRPLPFILLSFASFSLTLFLYQAPRAFLPLFLPVLLFLYRPRMPKPTVARSWALFVLLIVFPVILILRTPQLTLRMRTLSLTATPESQLTIDEQIREDGTKGTIPVVSRIFHNKGVAYSQQFLRNFFLHLTYDFFFSDKPLPDRYRVPGSGILHLIELPLLLGGVVMILGAEPAIGLILLAWFLLSFVGSAATFDDIPNIQRTLLAAPAAYLLISYGASGILSRIPRSVRALAVVLLVAGYGWGLVSYLHQYYVHQPIHRPWYRQEGYAALIRAVNSRKDRYDRVVITNRETAPAVFFLFFNRYDPAAFQRETHGMDLARSDSIGFGGYTFSDEECPVREEMVPDMRTGVTQKQLIGTPGILYVTAGICQFPATGVSILEQIRRGDNTPVFQLVTVPAR